MASTAYDNFILGQQTEECEFPMAKKDVLQTPDSCNGSYSSAQLTFDLQNLASSNRYVDFKSSYLNIPLTMSLTAAATTVWSTEQANAFCMSLKNGNHQLIHSMAVQLSTTTVLNHQAFSNIPITYKLLTELSAQEMEQCGANYGFYLDSAESLRYDTTGAVQGEQNNCLIGGAVEGGVTVLATTGVSSFPANVGRMKRMMQNSAYNVTDAQVARYLPQSALDNCQKSSCVIATTGITYSLFANIPLRILSDLFDKFPLAKSCYWRLTFNLNCPCTFTCTPSTAAASVLSAVSSTSPNGVIPFMISPFSNTALGNRITTGTAATVASLSVGNATQRNCRLFMTTYQMSPEVEAAYIKDNIRRVVFNDFVSFQPSAMQGVLGQSSVSQTLIVPSLAKMRKLLIVPMTAAGGTAGIHNMVGGSALLPMSSPFSSSPATCSPFGWVSNLQVHISGQPMFQSNQIYRFENFMQEFNQCSAINGGGSIGLSQGLINQSMFDSAYGYVVVNLSRKSEESDPINQSLMVSFKNESLVTMNYFVFIFMEKEISLDCRTGQIVI